MGTPTELFVEHSYGTIDSENVTKFITLNAFQQLLLDLPPQSILCSNLFERRGHMQPFTCTTIAVPMTFHNYEIVCQALSTEMYEKLFGTPGNPDVLIYEP